MHPGERVTVGGANGDLYEALLKKRAERGTYTCACCGEQFLPIRADARYCSNGCRQKGYRQRKANAG